MLNFLELQIRKIHCLLSIKFKLHLINWKGSSSECCPTYTKRHKLYVDQWTYTWHNKKKGCRSCHTEWWAIYMNRTYWQLSLLTDMEHGLFPWQDYKWSYSYSTLIDQNSHTAVSIRARRAKGTVARTHTVTYCLTWQKMCEHKWRHNPLMKENTVHTLLKKTKQLL